MIDFSKPFSFIDEINADGELVQGQVGPLVVAEIHAGENEIVHIPAIAVFIESVGSSPAIGGRVSIVTAERTHTRQLGAPQEFIFDRYQRQGHFLSLENRLYWIRPFCDQDGVWASYLQIPVPAEVLEKRLWFEMEETGGFNPCNEEIFVLTSNDLEIDYLAYSAIGQIWLREKGEWQPLVDPTGMLLDGLTIREVNPRIIYEFDDSESREISAFAEFLID